MSLDAEYISQLEAENDALRERIRQLEHAMGVTLVAPLELDLTGQQSRIFGLLYKRDLVTKDLAIAELYACQPGDAPDAKIVDVFICHLRRKLKPFEIEIKTAWGQSCRQHRKLKWRRCFRGPLPFHIRSRNRPMRNFTARGPVSLRPGSPASRTRTRWQNAFNSAAAITDCSNRSAARFVVLGRKDGVRRDLTGLFRLPRHIASVRTVRPKSASCEARARARKSQWLLTPNTPYKCRYVSDLAARTAVRRALGARSTPNGAQTSRGGRNKQSGAAA